MRKIVILLFSLIVSFVSVQAQIFKYLGTDEGLSSRRVLSVRQTEQSYMWILTHKGVDRYDGKRFIHYNLQKDGRTVNFYPNLNSLKTDSKNRLWEIGKDGLAFCFDRMKNQFQLKFYLCDSFPETRKKPVTAIYLDKQDNIWFCVDNQQYIYRCSENRSVRLERSVPGKVISITQASDDLFYMATEYQLYAVRLQGDALSDVQVVDLKNISRINYIYYHASSGQLVVNTLLDKLFIYHPQTRDLVSMGNTMEDIGVNAIIPCRKNKDEILIATDGDGVYKLNVPRRKLGHFLQEDNKQPNKMNGSIIEDIYIDYADRIWIAIYPMGITVYNEKYPSYEWVKHSPNYTNSLVNNSINGIIEDSEGDTWYATDNGVSCYNPRTNRWTNYCSSFKDDFYSDNHIFFSLCEIHPGIILAGGYMSGVYLINKRTGKSVFYQQESDQNNETPDKYIRSIYKDDEGIIWTGGMYSLKAYEPEKRQNVVYDIGYSINQITRRDSVSLWIGSMYGIYVFDKTRKELRAFHSDIDFGCINTIYTPEEPDGNTKTYFGTYGNGLFVVDNRTGEITHYHTENSSLQTNNIFSILPNRNGGLMLGTELGLSLFNETEETFTYWSKEQGLLPADFNPNAAVRTSYGKLIFGSNDGAIVLPDSVSLPDKFSSRMVFSNFSIMYRSVIPGVKGSPLVRPLDETPSIELGYNQNTFSLEVSSINYDNPSNIQYSWKLEGFYDGWTPPSSDGLIRYTNLSPGNYTLKVRSILQDNHLVLEERTIQIIIGRPFWLTFWAFLIYAALIIGATYAWFRYQVIKRERRISKEKINFFTSAAHDIRTPLTLIKAPLSEIQRNEHLSEQGKANIGLAIQNTESLSELADNLLNFQKEDVYSSQTIVSEHELNDYLRKYLHPFKEYASQIGISLAYKSDFENLTVWIDRNKMDSIIRNLLSNALKYTPQGGSITVEAWHNKNRWFLCVSDTGIGIPKENQKKLFKYLFRGANATNQLIAGCGIGMLLTYRQIKNHEGKITFTSTEKKGTSFYLSFPIHSRNYRYKPSGQEEESKNVFTGQISTSLLEEVEVDNTRHPDAPLILVVEDNTALRSFILQNLSEIYRVVGVENGQRALEEVMKQQPDLVLSDVMMPVMDGKELCRRIKGNMETSHIPVILLTALGSREQILQGLEIKADQYIVKPFDMKVLEATIHTVLENRNLIRMRYRQAIDHLEDEAMEAVPPVSAGLDDEFMQRVTALVKEKLGNDLTVDTLCAAVNMSRTSFYNKIKALTGIAPNDFIRNIRMKEAAYLLKTHRYTIAEIADRVGFADPKYFTDAFKKFYGVPPSVYMKQDINHTTRTDL